MGTVLPNSQCAMGALPSNHRITITDQFLLDFSPSKRHPHSLSCGQSSCNCFLLSSSFRDAPYSEASHWSRLNAAILCEHIQPICRICMPLKPTPHVAVYHRNKTQYGHLSAFCWIIKLKKKKDYVPTHASSSKQVFFASLSSQNNIKNKNWVRKMTRCSSISSAIWGAFAGGLPTEATLPWKQTHTLENLKKIL